MVHQHDGSAVAALQAAQISEQWGDLSSEVLIETVQTKQRVKHKQFGFEAGDCGVKRPLLLGVIERICASYACKPGLTINAVELEWTSCFNKADDPPSQFTRIRSTLIPTANQCVRWGNG
jgi:hypothetical protein